MNKGIIKTVCLSVIASMLILSPKGVKATENDSEQLKDNVLFTVEVNTEEERLEFLEWLDNNNKESERQWREMSKREDKDRDNKQLLKTSIMPLSLSTSRATTSVQTPSGKKAYLAAYTTYERGHNGMSYVFGEVYNVVVYANDTETTVSNVVTAHKYADRSRTLIVNYSALVGVKMPAGSIHYYVFKGNIEFYTSGSGFFYPEQSVS